MLTGSALASTPDRPAARVALPLAQLRVVTLAPRVRQAVVFSLAGSKLEAGRRLRSLTIRFGDGTSARLSGLRAAPHHTYQKPGAYVARLTLVDSSGHRSVAARTLVVGAPTRVVLRKSTMKLRGSRVTGLTPISPSRETLRLAAGTPLPTAGHTLLIGASSLAPNGLIAVVQRVKRNSDGSLRVTVRDGSLSDAYARLSVVSRYKVGRKLTLSSTRSAKHAAAPEIVPASAVPFSCSTSPGKPINVTADLSNTSISATVDLAAAIFSFNVDSQPTFSLGVDFTGSATCQLADGFALNIPVPEVPGLVISVGPYFSLAASGTISASATWSPSLFLSIVRAPGHNSRFLQYSSHASGSASGSASVTLEGGIQVTVSVGHAAGLRVSLGPAITATASASSSQACINVTSDIELEAELFADVLWVHSTVILYDGQFFKSTLFNRCTASSSGASGSGSASPPQNSSGGSGSGPAGAPYNGPTITEVTGSVASTWSDYADAGGTEGPSIGAGQSLGVVCRLIGFKVADGNTWWYLIGSSPWNAEYYVSADPFYNGPTTVPLRDTPFVDTSVPLCSTSAGPPPTPTTPPTSPTQPTAAGTYPETTGSVAHTWTDYSDAGGSEGPEIGSNQTVQITCRVQGFEVADGNTWWYQIASSPWNNAYYVSADPFYNDGQTSGSLNGTPFYDPSVPTCAAPVTTYPEATGDGPVHTWSSPDGPSGTEGPTLAANTVYQVVCVVTGTKEGPAQDPYWYLIAGTSDYGSADAFCDEGATTCPGGFAGTPDVDPNVPSC